MIYQINTLKTAINIQNIIYVFIAKIDFISQLQSNITISFQRKYTNKYKIIEFNNIEINNLIIKKW